MMKDVRLTFLKVAPLPPVRPNAVMLRLLLYQDEVYRLPRTARGVRVLAGRAWLTVAGEDVFVTPGEQVTLSVRKDGALISALGQLPLILEIYQAS